MCTTVSRRDFTRQNPLCPAAKALNGGHLAQYRSQPG
jgi:hypothetical protein